MNWPSGDPNQPPYSPPPPPPMPYQQNYGQPGAPGGYPYPAPKKSRKGLIIALVAVGVVLLGGVIVAGAFLFVAVKEAKNNTDKVVATDLVTGDCLTDIPNGSLVSLVPKVACSEPHSGEVYAVLNMPEGDYPGGAAILAYQNKCPAELQSYAPNAMDDESVSVFVLYPTAETWATGDRAITCIATTDDKRTGSVKG